MTVVTACLVALSSMAWTTGPADDSVDFAALKASYHKAREDAAAAARKAYEAQVEAAKKAAEAASKDGKTKGFSIPAMTMISGNTQALSGFSARFLTFATDHPNDPNALDALSLAYSLSGGPRGASGMHGKVLKIFETQFASHAQAGSFARQLANDGDAAAVAALKAIIEKNPDLTAQAHACRVLAGNLQTRANRGRLLARDENARKSLEKLEGKERVEALIQHAAETEQQAKRYSDLLDTTYAKVLPRIAVGSPAPELTCTDLDGKPVRLSDLKGRVVVLDFWATWCGPCRAMIPHEREMVERLKGKPFTLVSLSADEKRETVTEFLRKESMPWTHWWIGASGGVHDSWDLQFFPTIYVIDAQGVIRHTGLRNEKLEAAVSALLDHPSRP